MKLKRFLSLLLVLCTLLTLVPASVLPVKAAEPEVKTGSAIHLNPRYQGVLNPNMFGSRAKSAPKTYAATSYVSEASAAKQMRQAMVERAYAFSVSFKSAESSAQDAVYAMFDKAVAHTGNPKEGDYLLYTYGGWYASWSYYYDSGYYYISIDFDLDYYTTASQEAAMDTAVKNLMAKLDLDGKTDYQKIYAIYDYITETVRYDHTNLNNDSHLLKYTGYAALVNKTAVCQGYANLFYRLALEADVDARIISGDGGGPHAWNIVALDGKYYNLDSTWDEGQPYFSWFLLSPNSFYNHYRDSEYETTAFHKDYPMSSTDYVYDSVKSNIQIVTQPKSVKVAVGETAKVTVKALGTGLTYQWYYKDPGASGFTKSSFTGTTYSASMTAAKSGRQVYCIIKDAYGNQLKSNTATLTATSNIKITTQPKNVVAPNGSTAKATVKASGDGLTYTWYYTLNKSDSEFHKSSTTTATYSVTMNADRNGRKVYCVITDKYGNSVKTNTVTLTMGNPAKITTQPKNMTAPNGSTAKATVKASGDGLTYTWYYTLNKSDSEFYKSSTTTATYSITMNADRDGRKVYCVVTDKYGTSVKSNTVTLTMGNPAKITTQPKNMTAPNGSTAKATVKASGDGLTYTWYYTLNKSDSEFYKSSTTTATYSITMNADRDGRKIYCVITDKYGNSVKSNTVTLTMGNPAKITTQPKNAAAPNGSTAKTTVKATGDGLTYTWYYTLNKSDSEFHKSSTTSATYSTTMNADRDGRKVYCVITDKYGNSVKSSTVTLSMGNPAKITTQPTSVTVASGATAKTTVKATGDGLTYTWYYTLNKSDTEFHKSSTTTATYSVTMNADRDGRKIYCVITDKYGTSVKTDTVTLKLK